MPRILAIEWEGRQARYVAANVRGDQISLVAADTVTLPADTDLPRGPHPDLAAALSSAIAEAKVGSKRALVGISRAAVDLRQLSLPPATDDELPDLVRHQASRELSGMGESATLDFVPVNRDPQEPRTVLAASLGSDHLQQVNTFSSQVGVQPERMLLRSFASASLFARHCQQRPEVCLLVDVLCDEADLTVLDGDRVIVSRCLRLPEGDDPVPLLAEIRRTMVAVQNQAASRPVESVYLCGTDQEHEELLHRLNDVLAVPVNVFDPFAAVNIGGKLSPTVLRESGQFTALVGMLDDEGRGTPHGIDFLHPRRRPDPPSRKRLYIGGGAVAAAVLLFLGYTTWSQFAELDAQINQLKEERQQNGDVVKRAKEMGEKVAAIEAWTQGDVLWLEELRELSERFPSARNAALTSLIMSRSPAGGGTMEMSVLVRDPAIIATMEESLRDEFHEVRSKRMQESGGDKAYAWQFESSLSVAKRDPASYQNGQRQAATQATATER